MAVAPEAIDSKGVKLLVWEMKSRSRAGGPSS